MATFTEVNKFLSELPIGDHKLTDIVKKIRSVSSPKHKKQINLAKQEAPPEYLSRCSGHNLNDVWVDISYQRSLKLKKIYDHLKLKDENDNDVGFSSTLCGTVDFAIRPNGKVFVWDGFRRCIISMLKGINKIPTNDVIHDPSWSDRRCQKKEAFSFTQKNSAMEPMKQEELFKAGCAQGNEFYLGIKEVLVGCELDVLQINQGKAKLGGYVEFEKLVTKSPFSEGVTQSSNSFIEEASKLIQSAWPNEEVSGFMLSGFGHYLHANEVDGDNGNQFYIDRAGIEEKLETYVKEKKGTQSSCTKDRLHSKPRQSVAWRICKNVFDMSSIDASKFIGMDDEQSEMLSVSNK